MAEVLEEKRQDAGEFIKEILQKMPEAKKERALGIIIGISLGESNEKEDAPGDRNARPA